MTSTNKFKTRARKAVATRKANQAKRSAAAKRAWMTRRDNAAFYSMFG